MARYIAGLIDETGCYFTAETDADNRGEAWDIFEDDYPESRVESVSTLQETIDSKRDYAFDVDAVEDY